jgi:pimeloyl-ACP methyl ester carboxylesterase
MYAQVDLLLYINSVKNDTDDGNLGIIAVEVMPISSRIGPTALSAGETRDEIKKILDAYGWDEFVLVGHSYVRHFKDTRSICIDMHRYGSAIAATILRDPTFPTTSIKMAILLDPISFMLHLPDVAYNFVSYPQIYLTISANL